MQLSCLRFRLRLLLGLFVLGSIAELLPAADDQPKGLTPQVERALRWLPEDTETLIVARSVLLPLPLMDPDRAYTWQEMGMNLATADFNLVDDGKISKPLRDRKIEYVVHGAKNFDSVSSFGSLRSEGCSIIGFEADLGDAAKEWVENLRKGSKAVKTLVGREVFVFPSTTVMEGGFKQTAWQGTYFVLLDPKTIICASSDRYLEAVLRRVDGLPGPRAFPESLSEWKYVEFDAPVWMLRHLPKVDPKSHSVGLTIAFLKDGFHVVYAPETGSDQDLNQIKRSWERWLVGPGADDQKATDRVKMERRTDGNVIVRIGGKIHPEESPAENLGLAWKLYWLQGQPIIETID
jgi:hypothetical protein